MIVFIIINNILSKALDYNSLNKNSDVSNHFLNNFEMSETDINGNIAWNLKETDSRSFLIANDQKLQIPQCA